MQNFKKKYKIFLGLIFFLILIIIGFNVFTPKHQGLVVPENRYNKDGSRKTIDVSQTTFVKQLEKGKIILDNDLGGKWRIEMIPLNQDVSKYIKEKIVFIKENENIENYTELVVIDTYSENTFSDLSSYLKKHAEDLHKKNNAGKIKVIQDNSKNIIYQWYIPNIDGTIKYLEFGKIELTTEGVMSIKYINKGTTNINEQKNKMLGVFYKI